MERKTGGTSNDFGSNSVRRSGDWGERETGAFARQEQDGLEEQSRSCSATIRDAVCPCFDAARGVGVDDGTQQSHDDFLTAQQPCDNAERPASASHAEAILPQKVTAAIVARAIVQAETRCRSVSFIFTSLTVALGLSTEQKNSNVSFDLSAQSSRRLYDRLKRKVREKKPSMSRRSCR